MRKCTLPRLTHNGAPATVISPSQNTFIASELASGAVHLVENMTLRTLLSAFVLTAAAVAPAVAQRPTIITDKAPSEIIAEPGSSRLHVITAGVDLNFNGELDLDSGDVAPRWFVIDSDTDQLVDSTTFDALFHSFPLRVGFDPLGRRLYAAQDGRIRSYDIGTLDLIDDTVALGRYSGVSFEPRSRLVLAHMRPGFTEPGYVVAINPVNGDTSGVYNVGVNPQMSVSIFDPITATLGVYTLNEGSFGSPNATISFAGGNPDIFTPVNGAPLGNAAGNIAYFRRNFLQTFAIIPVFGDDVVRVLNSVTHRQLRAIDVPAPTVAAFDTALGGSFMVGTASGMLFRFREYDGMPRDTFALPGAVRAIGWNGPIAAIVAGDSAIVLFDALRSRVLDTIAAGGTVQHVFFDALGRVHAIGYADDSTSGWWRIIDPNSGQVDETRSIAGLRSGLGVVYDALTDSLLAVVRDAASGRNIVVAYGAADASAGARVVYDDSTAAGRFVGVNVGPEHIIVLEQGAEAGGSGYVHALERATGMRVIKALVGVNPTVGAIVSRTRQGDYGIYVVNHPDTASTLSFVAFNRNLLGGDTLGSGANHLLALGSDQDLVVTMNGSHTVVGVNLQGSTVTHRIPTGTSGFDGPRESIEIIGSIGVAVAVTTYAGDVRLIENDAPYRIEQTGGKSEGLVRVGNRLYVANAFTPTYAADSTVVIIDLTPGGVEAEHGRVTALDQNTPNPAVDRTRVHFTLADAGWVRLEVRTLTGEIVALPIDRQMEPGGYTVDLPVEDFTAGTYLYTLHSGTSVASRIMQVVR
jgi:hypothetical protein